MNYLRSVARYAWKDQIRNTKIRENSIFVINKMRKQRALTVKMEGPTSLPEDGTDQAWPNP
jgi:hypothetical protein